jgi:hypothetical protein
VQSKEILLAVMTVMHLDSKMGSTKAIQWDLQTAKLRGWLMEWMKVSRWVQLEEMLMVVTMGSTKALNWGLLLVRLVLLCLMDNIGS